MIMVSGGECINMGIMLTIMVGLPITVVGTSLLAEYGGRAHIFGGHDIYDGDTVDAHGEHDCNCGWHVTGNGEHTTRSLLWRHSS